MLNGLVGKIRGVNTWPETMATVASVARYEQSVGEYGSTQSRACISFWYRDGKNDIQSGEFIVDEDSSLFDQEKDSTFAIKYNPGRPNLYWTGEYTSTFDGTIYIVLGLLIAVLVLIVIIER